MHGTFVDYQEVNQFSRCPRRWAWGSQNGRNLGFYNQPTTAKQALRAALRAYVTDVSFHGAISEILDGAKFVYRTELERLPHDTNRDVQLVTGLGVLDHFHSRCPTLGIDLQVGIDFTTDLFSKTDTNLYTSSDAVVEKDGSLWLVRFIVSSRHVADNAWRWEHFDDDANLLLWSARESGFEFAGVCYIYVRFKAPVRPEVLKHGGLSKRKDIDTTYEIYRYAISENGLDWRQYDDMLNVLASKPDTFFHVQFHMPTRDSIDNSYKRAKARAQAMWHTRAWEHIAVPYARQGWCSSCPFTRACTAFDNGQDWEFELSVAAGKLNEVPLANVIDFSWE